MTHRCCSITGIVKTSVHSVFHIVCSARALLAACLLVWGILPGLSQADTTRDFGKHIIHCKAVSTAALDSEVAQALGVSPDATRGVLTIAIMEKTAGDDMGQPSKGKVTAHWSDLIGMMGTIPIREVVKEKAIYYVGEFELPSSSTMTFDVLISVDESRPPYRLEFKKSFDNT